MTEQPDIASLLCSRLCHDLLSPVGAMNNGLELLAEENDPEMRKRCLELLEESARTTAERLKFYRLAFGAAGGFGERIDPGEARGVLDSLTRVAGRVSLDWRVPAAPLPKAAVKMLLNLALIAHDALVRGGTLLVAAEPREGETEIAVKGEGPRIVLDSAIRATLRGEAKQVDSRTAAARMVVDLAHAGGGYVQVADAPEMIAIGALVRR